VILLNIVIWIIEFLDSVHRPVFFKHVSKTDLFPSSDVGQEELTFLPIISCWRNL